jgi:4-hydroxy-3-polyprenylbenzoate decarboxylase
MTSQKKKIIVAITGASGAPYAKRLIESLVAADVEVLLIVSTWGKRLLHDELGMEGIDLDALAGRADHNMTLLPYKDVGACVASGSFKTDAMVIIPCSNNKLAELAHGLGDNLVSRAAQVILKERRRLIIVHREMPLGLIELRNMTALAEAGAIICPANPGFYNLPQTVDDLVNMVVGRVMDLVDVPHQLHERWSGKINGDSGATGPDMTAQGIAERRPG